MEKVSGKTIYEVMAQCSHCFAMMQRLKKDVDDIVLVGTVIENHTRMESDIVHLRRELNELRKMLGCYGWKWVKEK